MVGFKVRSGEPVLPGAFVWYEALNLRNEPFFGRVIAIDLAGDQGDWASVEIDQPPFWKPLHRHFVLRKATPLEVLASLGRRTEKIDQQHT